LQVADKVRLGGELAEAEEKLQSLESQCQIYKAKLAELEVRSPIDGEVETWDLKNRLLHRPVQRGQLLLRVANPAGDWQLELHMAEDRMGHIARAQQKIRFDLPVTYIVATEPGGYRKGTIKEVGASTQVFPEEGNVVLIKVKINKDDVDPADLKPGASVTAKIYCGRRSVGYVWFHDLLAFIQSRVLFRL